MDKRLKLALAVAAALVVAIAVGRPLVRWIMAPSGTIFVSGQIEATEVRASFRVAGKVQELFVDEGATVVEGQPLARLDKDELTQQALQAKNAEAEATALYERQRDDAVRAEKLYRVGGISAQKRDAARTAAETTKASQDAAVAASEIAALRLGYAELASPLAGFVLVKSAEAGEVVQVGAPIFTIANLRDVWLEGYVSETDLGKVKLGAPAEIRTDTYPRKSYRGRVTFISEESEFTPKHIQTKEERVKRVYRVKITASNEAQELKPGMPAEAWIKVP
jgi:HlyD family secretion protein